MATSKVTFTLDQATINRLRDAAERLAKPKSEVVREAIHDYHERMDRLSERERLEMLRALDEYAARMPRGRSAAAVDRELAEIRRARRAGGRRSLGRQR
jgi:predicted DNA-binding protein